MGVKTVSETGESEQATTPEAPPPLLTPVLPTIQLTDAASTVSLGTVTVPSEYLYWEPKRVYGCVVVRQVDNQSEDENYMVNSLGQFQVRNAGGSGVWTQLYTFTSGQLYVGSGVGLSTAGDVLIGTTRLSGLTALGGPMSIQLCSGLDFQLVSGIVANSGMTLRDVRAGIVIVY